MEQTQLTAASSQPIGPLRNSLRRLVSIFFWIALWFLLGGILIAVVIIALVKGEDGQMGGGIVGMIMACFAVAMLLAGLISWPAARKAGRELKRFEQGDCLVCWRYEQGQWTEFIGNDARKKLRIWFWVTVGIALFALAVGLLIGFAGQMIQYPAYYITMGCIFLGCYLLYAFIARNIRKARERRLTDPIALVGEAAAYCGGDMFLWGSGTRSLQEVKLTEKPPVCLEIAIGPGRKTRSTMAVVGIAAALAGRYTGSAQNMIQRMRIPIPPGAEDEAQAVINQLRAQL